MIINDRMTIEICNEKCYFKTFFKKHFNFVNVFNQETLRLLHDPRAWKSVARTCKTRDN